jgi:nucleotide-binding universal stress UspA family protein
MFHKILVGVDGRDGGLDAAALARQLVGPDGALLLVHIHHGYPIAAKAETGDYERIARADAQALLARVSKETGIRAVIAHGAPSVGRGIRDVAEQEAADLVVIGATRRAPIANIFVGDATRETLRAAHGAVAVAPVGYAEHPAAIRTVGVAFDASHESRGAAAVAHDLGAELHAKLSAIQVLDIPSYIIYSDRAAEMPGKSPLALAARDMPKLGEFEPQVSFGYVGDGLAEATHTVDLLVMGSRSLGRVGRLLRTSRSENLARRSRCPLLILPEPAAETYQGEHPTSRPVTVRS